MAFYYILNSGQLTEHTNNLDHPPVWNVANTQCIVEVNPSYVIENYLVKCEKSNDVQDYINDPIRIDEWYQPDISEIP